MIKFICEYSDKNFERELNRFSNDGWTLIGDNHQVTIYFNPTKALPRFCFTAIIWKSNSEIEEETAASNSQEYIDEDKSDQSEESLQQQRIDKAAEREYNSQYESACGITE